MTDVKILLSNMAYARGINGSLMHHIRYAHRHLFCSRKVQQGVMGELKKIILREQPDICCLVEIDRGHNETTSFNQLHALLDSQYHFSDIASKYGDRKALRRAPFLSGKSNAFCSKREFPFERVYLSTGMKRLVYRITVAPDLHLFFCHFSLMKTSRQRQFVELRALIDRTPGEHIIMGDFNIFGGISELQPLLEGTDLRLINNPEKMTFKFHRNHKLLDLCICSRSLGERSELQVIEQHYSDHCALLLHVKDIAVFPQKK